MPQGAFAATVADWVHKVEGAAEAVFKESTQELVNVAQTPIAAGGRMHVDTGFLRASLLASTSMVPPINPAARPKEGSTYPADFGQIEAVIIGAELGQTIYLGYTASYAGAREYGARGQPPDAYVRSAAQRWPMIVEAKTLELRQRLGL